MSTVTTKKNFGPGNSGRDVIYIKYFKQERKMSIETTKQNFDQGDSGLVVIFIKYC